MQDISCDHLHSCVWFLEYAAFAEFFPRQLFIWRTVWRFMVLSSVHLTLQTPGNEYIKMQGTSHTTIENNQDPATHYVSFK